jgi:hypothetical protein
MSNLLGKKKSFEYSYQYASRITSRLIKIAHFLEIFEVRGNAPLGILFLSLMQLSAAYLAGSKGLGNS